MTDDKKPVAKKAGAKGKSLGAGLLVARASFSVGNTTIQANTIVPEDDPIVKGREHLFDELAGRVRTTRKD